MVIVKGIIMVNDGNGSNTEGGEREILNANLLPLFEGITRLLNWERAVFNIAILTIFV